MKKMLAIIAAIMLVASAAYSLDSMKDTDMDSVTGQAGLTISTYGATATSIAAQLEGLSWGDDNGAAAPAGTAAAGHLRVAASSADGLSQGYIGVTITIPTGAANASTVDVDATGIVLGSPSGLAIAVTTPSRIQLSIASGVVSAFGGIIDGTTTEVLGDLAVDTLNITVTPALITKIAPH